MLDKKDPTNTRAWRRLTKHHKKMKTKHMRHMFNKDPERFNKFSLRFKDILLDYSKNIITEETIKILLSLAKETKVKEAIDKMFSGDKINETENRAALHIALRNQSEDPICVDGQDVMPRVRDVLKKMEIFSEKVISGEWKGFTGKPIRNIVNIGIGGSDLGPYMVTEALKPYKKPNIDTYFVNNVLSYLYPNN